jgi:hypothetical protein
MHQPYPSSGQAPAPQQPPMPTSVQTAVRLMYAGAGLTFVELVVGLSTIGGLRSRIIQHYPHYTASQVHSLEVGTVVALVLEAVIAIGLWLWMARASAAGRNYARITGTVLFGLNTLFLLLSLRSPQVGLGLVFYVLVWLAGLGAVIMLWRSESASWFSQPPR